MVKAMIRFVFFVLFYIYIFALLLPAIRYQLNTPCACFVSLLLVYFVVNDFGSELQIYYQKLSKG